MMNSQSVEFPCFFSNSSCPIATDIWHKTKIRIRMMELMIRAFNVFEYHASSYLHTNIYHYFARRASQESAMELQV
jgi:hypothetical protein